MDEKEGSIPTNIFMQQKKSKKWNKHYKVKAKRHENVGILKST